MILLYVDFEEVENFLVCFDGVYLSRLCGYVLVCVFLFGGFGVEEVCEEFSIWEFGLYFLYLYNDFMLWVDFWYGVFIFLIFDFCDFFCFILYFVFSWLWLYVIEFCVFVLRIFFSCGDVFCCFLFLYGVLFFFVNFFLFFLVGLLFVIFVFEFFIFKCYVFGVLFLYIFYY